MTSPDLHFLHFLHNQLYLKNRDKAFVKAALAKIPLEVKFNEKLAKNTEYKEAREAIKRVQSAKPTSNFL